MCCVGEIQFLGFAAGGTYNNHCALKVGQYTVFQRKFSINSVISVYLSRRFRYTQTCDICPRSLHTNCEPSYNPPSSQPSISVPPERTRCNPTSTPVYYEAVQLSCPLRLLKQTDCEF